MLRIIMSFKDTYDTHIHRNGDILIRGVPTSRANYSGFEDIYVPVDVMQANGLNAYNLSQSFGWTEFGFLADCNWDEDRGAWKIEHIETIFSKDALARDSKRLEMIAILRDRRTLPGETRLTLSEVDDIIALLTAPPMSVGGNRPSTGDFRCHHCKHVVKNVVAAPDRCPVCRCRDFSACAPSCSHAA